MRNGKTVRVLDPSKLRYEVQDVNIILFSLHTQSFQNKGLTGICIHAVVQGTKGFANNYL